MKKNSIAIILTLLLGGFATYMLLSKKNSTLDEDGKAFTLADTASVDKVIISDKKGNVATIQRKNKSIWTVNGKYNARKDAIDLILYTFKQVEVKSPVGQAALPNVIKDLASNGIKVEAFQNGDLTKVWYVGGQTQDFDGTFVLLSDPSSGKNYEQPYILEIPGFQGYLTSRFFTDEDDWHDRAVVKLLPPEMASVKMEYFGYPDSSFYIGVRDIHHFDFMIAGVDKPKTLDTLSVKQYLGYFSNLNCLQYFNNSKIRSIDSVKKTLPFAQLTVIDKSGNQQQVKFFHKAPEKKADATYGINQLYDPEVCYAWFNNNQDFASLQFASWGKLMQTSAYFRSKAVKK